MKVTLMLSSIEYLTNLTKSRQYELLAILLRSRVAKFNFGLGTSFKVLFEIERRPRE